MLKRWNFLKTGFYEGINHWTTVAKWKAGNRYPANAPSVIRAFEALLRRRRVPGRYRVREKPAGVGLSDSWVREIDTLTAPDRAPDLPYCDEVRPVP